MTQRSVVCQKTGLYKEMFCARFVRAFIIGNKCCSFVFTHSNRQKRVLEDKCRFCRISMILRSSKNVYLIVCMYAYSSVCTHACVVCTNVLSTLLGVT
jgi:hypothetical protein